MPERKAAFSFRGLDMLTMRTRMDPGASRHEENGDVQRKGTWRVRSGYARLLSASSAVVKVAVRPSRVFVFGRDDGEVALVVARGGGCESFLAGSAEWTT